MPARKAPTTCPIRASNRVRVVARLLAPTCRIGGRRVGVVLCPIDACHRVARILAQPRSVVRHADFKRLEHGRVFGVGGGVDPSATNFAADIAVAAIAVFVALAAAAGPSGNRIGAQALRQANLVGPAVIRAVEAVFPVGVAGDAQEIRRVDRYTLGLRGAGCLAATFDRALTVAVGLDGTQFVDAVGQVAGSLALQAAVDALETRTPDLRLAA